MWLILLLICIGLYLYLKNNSKNVNNYSPSNSIKYKQEFSKANTSSKKNYGKFYKDNYVVSLVDKNEIFIKEAILNKSKINFKYCDKDKNLTQRTVTPLRLFIHNFGEDGEMLCLDSFCHLRNSNRTFALFRMSSLT